MVAYRIVIRHDIGVAAKVVWIILILIFPIVGLLVYFLWDASSRARHSWTRATSSAST